MKLIGLFQSVHSPTAAPQCLKNNQSRSYKFKKTIDRGDMVRVSKVKGNFEKGYMPNWCDEHFLIESQKPWSRPVYKLKDKMGEEIKGVYYPEDVQRI